MERQRNCTDAGRGLESCKRVFTPQCSDFGRRLNACKPPRQPEPAPRPRPPRPPPPPPPRKQPPRKRTPKQKEPNIIISTSSGESLSVSEDELEYLIEGYNSISDRGTLDIDELSEYMEIELSREDFDIIRQLKRKAEDETSLNSRPNQRECGYDFCNPPDYTAEYAPGVDPNGSVSSSFDPRPNLYFPGPGSASGSGSIGMNGSIGSFAGSGNGYGSSGSGSIGMNGSGGSGMNGSVGTPPWLIPPPDGSLTTSAITTYRNPVTGETHTTNTGGYSISPNPSSGMSFGSGLGGNFTTSGSLLSLPSSLSSNFSQGLPPGVFYTTDSNNVNPNFRYYPPSPPPGF